MPKVKTKKSAKKRLKITATGKIKRACAHASHLLSGKDRKRKRRLRRLVIVSHADRKGVKRLLPYAQKH